MKVVSMPIGQRWTPRGGSFFELACQGWPHKILLRRRGFLMVPPTRDDCDESQVLE